jgi:IMP dehydrogenase
MRAAQSGYVTEADCEGVDRFTQVDRRHDFIDDHGASRYRCSGSLRRASKSGATGWAPVIDEAGQLVGLITRTGALRSTIYEP